MRLFKIIGIVMLFVVTASADFSADLNSNQVELYESATSSISMGAKMFFGLFPLLVPIATMLFIRKHIIKNMKQEDDDRMKILAVDAGLVIGSTLLGAFLVYMLGTFMFMKNGGGDVALQAFSTFWYTMVMGK